MRQLFAKWRLPRRTISGILKCHGFELMQMALGHLLRAAKRRNNERELVMQAIVTKFLGATDYRGSRVKAKCQGGTLTLSWDHALNAEENHRAAARALRRKMGWDTNKYPAMCEGALPNGTGNVYVFAAPFTVVK